MNYEAFKTFILIVLVCLSLFLSFILWSYKPNYDYLSDPDYVNEVDIGGAERTKTELIEPIDIVFHGSEKVYGFKRPLERRLFFKDVSKWILYDQIIRDSDEIPTDEEYVELIFPDTIPAEIIPSLLSFNDQIDSPTWSFERIYITLDHQANALNVIIPSIDDRKELVATIEKKERYESILNYFSENDTLEENIVLHEGRSAIYFPKYPDEMTEKTLVATATQPEVLINALFPNPSIVTHNIKEAYFTDGQRGMRTEQDKRYMQFINPMELQYERLDPIELFDNSITQVNEHKGWTNDFLFDEIDRAKNRISYRMHYEGYPIFTGIGSSLIEQQWSSNGLHEYARPLIRIGNLLNSHKVDLPSGKEIMNYLTISDFYELAKINNIKIGYTLRYLQVSRSIMLEPQWYVLYENEWKQLNITEETNNTSSVGGD